MVSPAIAALVVLALIPCFAVWAVSFLVGKRGEPVRDWFATKMSERRERGVVAGRPIEEIAAELRRRSARFHGLDRRASFVKVQAVRAAYDHTLAECCAALGITHLLGVLEPGPVLDAERSRVEELIADSGVRLPYAA